MQEGSTSVLKDDLQQFIYLCLVLPQKGEIIGKKRCLFYLLAPAGFISPVGNYLFGSSVLFWLVSALPLALPAVLRGLFKTPALESLPPGWAGAARSETHRVGSGGNKPGNP